MRSTVITRRLVAATPLAVAVCAWLLVVRLAWLLWRTDVAIAYVADVSRADAPWYYRLAALWGGPQGSLLLFAAVVAAAAVVGLHRGAPRWVTAAATATSAALVIVTLSVANPFTRRDAPAVRGAGLTPILEHPAMAVHPPVLYAGFGAAFVAAIRMAARRSPAAALRWTVVLLTAAMTLGALWSYVEQGWGGYWAWDPVENTSLLVWVAAVVALHARQVSRFAAVPWLATLVGSAMVRSGRTPSIHGFAEHPAVGWALIALAVGSLGWVVAGGVGPHPVDSRGDGERDGRRDGQSAAQRGAAVVMSVLAMLVALGTFLPALIGWITGRRVAVRGPYFSRVLGPLAAVVAVLVAAALLRRLIARRRLVVAHAGVLVLLGGFVATAFDTSERVNLAAGRPAVAAGLDVTLQRIDVLAGPRPGTSAVQATMTVDGSTFRPALVAYPELRGVLAETALRSRPWGDVQVALSDATDAGTAVVDVRRRPLTWLVWIGALLITVGAIPRRRGAGACGPGAPASSPALDHALPPADAAAPPGPG
ncbi:MAG: cytochrome c-type biogenesis CcmF C-terminal domain-containing protein [Ilumatobacteraceae bacterium]